MDAKQLDEIRKRAEAATAGPWGTSEDVVTITGSNGRDWNIAYFYGEVVSPDQSEKNAEFTAHARTDIPALLAALAASQERERAMREALTEIEAKTQKHDAELSPPPMLIELLIDIIGDIARAALTPAPAAPDLDALMAGVAAGA
jgi:hypothetical protein